MVKSILEAFARLPDPRWAHPNKLHKLIDIVVIAICGTLAKCESWEEFKVLNPATLLQVKWWRI